MASHRHSHGYDPGAIRWGLSDRLKNPPGLLLFNFDVGSAHLKMEHHEELRNKIVPSIRFRHGITVVGLASRTGSDALNMRLSYLRAENTLTALERQWRDFKRMPAVAFGKRKAKAEGVRGQQRGSPVSLGGDLRGSAGRSALRPRRDRRQSEHSQVPVRPIPDFSGSETDRREWMEGKRQACNALFEGMSYMDRKPEVVNSWELTGGRWLFQLYQKFGDRLEAAAKQEMRERLKGKSFPIMK